MIKNCLTILFLFCTLSVFSQARKNISLLGNIDYIQNGSALWGYVAPDSSEWVIMCTGTGTSIVDISSFTFPVEKFFIPGTATAWREAKTYGTYAYVSLDGTPDGKPDNGILIINLGYLPDSIQYYYWKGDSTRKIENSHTLFIDSLGFLYINGHDIPGTRRGVAICDLKPDPYRPQIVGLYDATYVHDSYVRNDTMWAAEINDGTCSVVDVSDKTQPRRLTNFFTPMRFTHNTWLSDDGKTLYTTDEKKFSTVGVYNVNDVFDIEPMTPFSVTPGAAAIPHNVRVIDDFLVISYYTEGVVIADAQDPENIIKTGFYDTSPSSGGTFNGCWEAFPYFPSGKIAASDIERGLFILNPKYVRACYLHGIAKDYFTGVPIPGVRINISEFPDTSSTKYASTLSKSDGTFKTGVADSGTYALWGYKAGYYPRIIADKSFSNGDTTYVEFLMVADSVDITNVVNNAPNELEVYPSLTNGEVFIKLPDAKQLTAQVFNMKGEQVLYMKMPFAQTLAKIDLGDLPAGQYTILLKDLESNFYKATAVKIR